MAARFALGQIVATRNALLRLTRADIMSAIGRHAIGDWGEICSDDAKANEQSLKEGLRLLSAYTAENGAKFWIITEADRSVTTVLVPEDY